MSNSQSTPISQPSSQPSLQPSRQPTGQPSRRPSRQPTSQPSLRPSGRPTMQPTSYPTNFALTMLTVSGETTLVGVTQSLWDSSGAISAFQTAMAGFMGISRGVDTWVIQTSAKPSGSVFQSERILNMAQSFFTHRIDHRMLPSTNSLVIKWSCTFSMQAAGFIDIGTAQSRITKSFTSATAATSFVVLLLQNAPSLLGYLSQSLFDVPTFSYDTKRSVSPIPTAAPTHSYENPINIYIAIGICLLFFCWCVTGFTFSLFFHTYSQIENKEKEKARRTMSKGSPSNSPGRQTRRQRVPSEDETDNDYYDEERGRKGGADMAQKPSSPTGQNSGFGVDVGGRGGAGGNGAVSSGGRSPLKKATPYGYKFGRRDEEEGSEADDDDDVGHNQRRERGKRVKIEEGAFSQENPTFDPKRSLRTAVGRMQAFNNKGGRGNSPSPAKSPGVQLLEKIKSQQQINSASKNTSSPTRGR